jgi:replicative DNA helicase
MLLRGLLERKAARKLGITVVELRKGNLTDVQLSKLADLAALTSEIPLYHLPPGKTSFDIYARVEQLKSTIGVDIVFVDYLQILKDCWISNKENMRIRVGTASKTLKGIVNDFSIPVICASQLSRALEYRTDKRPTLADLRESGDIEQDADNVILLYRDMEEEPNILEAKIAKGRQTGSFPHVKLVWVEKEQRYADYFIG